MLVQTFRNRKLFLPGAVGSGAAFGRAMAKPRRLAIIVVEMSFMIDKC
jgi:hypothetical protein